MLSDSLESSLASVTLRHGSGRESWLCLQRPHAVFSPGRRLLQWVSCLPGHCMPCWRVWPDDICSWWAGWPGLSLSLVSAQLLFLLTWLQLCSPRFYSLLEMSWDSASSAQSLFVLLMVSPSSLILIQNLGQSVHPLSGSLPNHRGTKSGQESQVQVLLLPAHPELLVSFGAIIVQVELGWDGLWPHHLPQSLIFWVPLSLAFLSVRVILPLLGKKNGQKIRAQNVLPSTLFSSSCSSLEL